MRAKVFSWLVILIGAAVSVLVVLLLTPRPEKPQSQESRPEIRAEALENSQAKVHTLQEFLNSVHAYRTKEKESRLGVASDLTGPDNLIEIEARPWEVMIEGSFETVTLRIDLFRDYQADIPDKVAVKERHLCSYFWIETASESCTITKDEFRQNRFNDLQKKLLDAALNCKRIKVKGFINGWGYGTDVKDKYFRYIRFNFRILEIQEVPSKE